MGFQQEIAERMELVVQFEPSISLQDVFELALKNEKEERIYEQKIICEFMKNESVEVIEVVNQQSETLEKETDEVERKEETELSVKNELSETSEENGKHLVREKNQGMRESIKKDSELVIHHNYTNNSNLSFSSILKVILQSFMPYNDPFDDVAEVPYAYEGINGGFILSKKNLRYSCFKFKRKQSEFNAYNFMNGSSMYQVCK